VVSLAQTSFTPVSGGTWNNLVAPDAAVASASGKLAYFNQAGPGYFKTMGTRLIAGREFNEHDTPSSPKAAIVNEKFARTLFGAANPVGHTFHMSADAGKPEPVFQIVGLVGNTKDGELREEFVPIAFFPVAQEDDLDASAHFVVRIAGAAGRFTSAAKSAASAVNPAMGIGFRSLSGQIEDSLLRERLMATFVARLWTPGGAAGHAWSLWCHCLYGGATPQRDWRTHRTRRGSERRDKTGPAGGRTAGRSGTHGGDCPRDVGGQSGSNALMASESALPT